MSSFGDGRGMEQLDADRRYVQKGALRLVGLRPFGFQTGRLDISDTGFFGYHTLTEPIDNLVLFYANFHTFTAGSETNAQPITISASVRTYDSGIRSGPWHFTFNGSATSTLGTKQLVGTDPLFTGFIPGGTNRLAISTRVQCALGENVPSGTSTGSSGYSADGNGLTFLNGLNPTVTSGVIYSPCAVGTYVLGGKRSGVLILGDSIEAGTGESSGQGSPHGWAARRLEALGVGYAYAPRSGETAQEWNEYSRYGGRIRLASLVPVVITGWIVNDVGNNRTFEQVKADLISIWANLRKAGVERIYQKTCVPKVTPNVSFDAASNQTNGFTPSQQAVRNALNQWLRSGQAVIDSNYALSGILDVAKLVEVNASNVLTEEGGLWLTNGSPYGYTTDGLHPSTAGHILMGSSITQEMADEWRRGY